MSDPSSGPSAILASVLVTEGGDEEYWWIGTPGERGAVVFKTDRFGQRWTLDLDATHWVTQRVAAGLLGVSVMTVNNWIREGRITDSKRRKVDGSTGRGESRTTTPRRGGSVSVIPLKTVERIAEERGMFIHRAPPPGERRAMRAASVKRPHERRKGGEKDADES